MKLSDRILNVSTMMNIQNELNCIMRSKGWADNNSPDRLSVEDYQTQISVELVELITESGVDFKWWKHCDVESFDSYNSNLEAIDILHFALSAAWLSGCNTDGSFDTSIFRESFVGYDVAGHEGFKVTTDMKLLNGNKLNKRAFQTYMVAFGSYQNMDPNATPLQQSQICVRLIQSFMAAMCLRSDYISALYRAKYELNKFRMSDGYKNGTYVKVQDGLEDNQRLKPIVEKFVEDQTLSLDWVAAETRKQFFQSNL